jgi:hypothetical protein
VVLFAVALAPLAAHEGPPFPIALDRPAGPYRLSIWTDPDVGTGIVYVVLEALGDAAYARPSGVRVGVQPVSARLPETLYDAAPETVRRGGRYVTEVAFDRQEIWRIRALVDGPGGGGEVAAQVEATPPGTIGPLGLVVYAIPFLLLAAMWIRVALVRRRMTLPE